MDWIAFFKDWGGHILSTLGILGGFFLYLKHDKTLKEQEKLLNSLQIDELRRSANDEKQAHIKCNVIKHPRGRRTVRILNLGKSDARNIQIKIVDKENIQGVTFFNNTWAYDSIISEVGIREEELLLCIGAPDTIVLIITWDDNYSCNREISQTIQL